MPRSSRTVTMFFCDLPGFFMVFNSDIGISLLNRDGAYARLPAPCLAPEADSGQLDRHVPRPPAAESVRRRSPANSVAGVLQVRAARRSEIPEPTVPAVYVGE